MLTSAKSRVVPRALTRCAIQEEIARLISGCSWILYEANCSWSVNYPFLSHRSDSKTDNSHPPLYCCRICCTTVFTRLDGIAKLTPLAVVLVSVLTAPRVG